MLSTGRILIHRAGCADTTGDSAAPGPLREPITDDDAANLLLISALVSVRSRKSLARTRAVVEHQALAAMLG